MIKQQSKPLPVGVVDGVPKRCDRKRIAYPIRNLSAVTPGKIHAFHHMSACRQNTPLTADRTLFHT